MDKRLVALLDKDIPRINPLIANGLATTHLRMAEAYIDDVFRSASKGFPAGLKYLGCQRCTPNEEFNVISRKKGTRRTVNVAKSNIYLMKYYFSHNGVTMEPPRYIFLPYVDDAAFMHLGGSRFNISPILSDRVISVGVSDIFVRLLRDRLTFKRAPHSFMLNGKREVVQVSHSWIYHKSTRLKMIRATVKANCALMHYLLCKYGFTETFARFGKCTPVIGAAEINTNSFPETEWVICSSSQIKPKGCGRGYYIPSTLRLAIRKEEMTPMVKNMVAGFFYVVDHFPDRVKPDASYLDSNRLWMVLLGHIIFSGSISEGKLYDDVNDHIVSLDEYVDNLIINKLRDIGVMIDDIYQLFAMIIEHFNDWLLKSAGNVASMYDKELSIIYYVLYEITSAIFKLYFRLLKAASKKDLSTKEIISNMNIALKTGLIFSVTKNHGEISTVSSSGDNMAFKITSLLVPQGNSNKLNRKSEGGAISDPASRLHVSVAEVGNAHAITKSDPSGRSKINNCVQIGHNGLVLRNPLFQEMLDGVQKIINR